MNILKQETIQIDKKLLVNSTRRSIASAIDTAIVLMIRIFFVETLGRMWIEPILLKFNHDFKFFSLASYNWQEIDENRNCKK